MYNYFIERVKENLHVVLAMSPIGDTFRNRLRMFPSLINCCTIDWFQVCHLYLILSSNIMYVHVYKCICTCIYVHVHMYMYICTCIYVHVYMYMYMYTYMYICTCIYVHVHVYMYMYICTC